MLGEQRAVASYPPTARALIELLEAMDVLYIDSVRSRNPVTSVRKRAGDEREHHAPLLACSIQQAGTQEVCSM